MIICTVVHKPQQYTVVQCIAVVYAPPTIILGDWGKCEQAPSLCSLQKFAIHENRSQCL